MSEKEDEWHIKKWYKENYGTDPLKLGLPFKEVKNPYYSKAAPMKLWCERDVLPFKDEKGVELFKKRSERGQKAFQTRKNHLIEWFKQVKSGNPRVHEITRRLWEIGRGINELHQLKEKCRNNSPAYDRHEFWEFGVEHCKECKEKSEEQWNLREERERIFLELETISNTDKRTIQLARKYYRMEEVNKNEEAV